MVIKSLGKVNKVVRAHWKGHKYGEQLWGQFRVRKSSLGRIGVSGKVVPDELREVRGATKLPTNAQIFDSSRNTVCKPASVNHTVVLNCTVVLGVNLCS